MSGGGGGVSEPVRFGHHVYDAAGHWRVATLTLAADEFVAQIVQYHMDGVKLRGIEFETNRGRRLCAGAVSPELEAGQPVGDRRLTKALFDAPPGEMIVSIRRRDDTGHDEWPGCGLIEDVSSAPVPVGGGLSVASEQQRSPAVEEEELPAHLVCVVCLDAPHDVVFLPCAHRCTCSECAAMLQECPVCRAPVKRKQAAAADR